MRTVLWPCWFTLLFSVPARYTNECGKGTSNLTVYGADVLQSFSTASQDTCCQACADSSSCGAWFHANRSTGWSCDLFAAADLHSLKTGDCSKWATPTSCAAWISFSPPSPSPASGVQLEITMDARWTISPYLSSMSLVYAWAPDAVYVKNGSLSEYARQHRVATARYPAGMASYWNWEEPTGIMGQSAFDPSWDGTAAPTDQWMDIDEYLDFCEASGIRPLVGVNYNCHKSFWVSEEDSIARAVRQVQHVKDRGFAGSFWYVGNEDGAAQHATRIMKHVVAMKQVDPTLKAFWNNNNMSPTNLKAFLEETGDVMDGAEFHGKWPYGGKPNINPFTVPMWMDEVPLMEHKSKETWQAKIAGLRAAAAEAGRPELLLANNEFGLGKPSLAFSDAGGAWTRFLRSMVNVEFAMEMYLGGYDMAVFWDNHDGGSLEKADSMLMDTSSGYRFNPMHFGFEMLAESTNASMLSMVTSARTVHGFAALTDSELLVYIINKFEEDQDTSIAIDGFGSDQNIVSELASMVDTDDHWGRMDTREVTCGQHTAGLSCKFSLPGLSFSQLRVPRMHLAQFV